MLGFKHITLAMFVSVWLLTLPVGAQPHLSGILSGTLGPGTYIVDGDCQVIWGTTVTVEPGSEFLFSGHYVWHVSGELSAIGTDREPIVFRRQFPTEACRWGGIRFEGTGASSSILDYCIIDHCENMIYPNWDGGGIYTNNTSPTIKNTRISNCEASSGGGVYAANNSAIMLDRCTVINCTAGNGGGIYLSSSGGAVITNCVIARNSCSAT